MNHAYRLIWSQLTQSWIAVSEVAKGKSKGSGSKLAVAALLLTAAVAHAGPTGGKIVSGSGSIASNGATTTITQSTSTLSVNWNSFNIAPKETVTFVQPSASSVALNRIFDTSGTRILGTLNANGQVFLVNPNGIVFGKGAQVNVGGLVASTLDVNDASLGNGKLTFSGNGTGSVINYGTISAANGGYVALLGNHVANEGSIIAKMGTVALGAGSAVTLNFGGNSLLSMQVDQSTLNALAANGGLIQADGGAVLMTAGARDALLASVVNNTGVIEARTVENHNGTITLLGGMAEGTVNVGGTLDASAPNGGNGGSIETSAAHVKVAPDATITTLAPNGKTGSWLIDPTDFTVAASGGDMTGATLSSALNSSDVQLQSTSGAASGSGDININDAVSWNAGTKLTLTAQNDININKSITATNANGQLSLQYGMANVAAGNAATYNINTGANASVNLQAGNNFTTQLGTDGTPTVFTVITSLGSQGSMTGADLQGINGNLAGNYALGSDIAASATSGWNSGAGFAPIGGNSTFNGKFDGLGHAIDGLTINVNTNYNYTAQNVGPFAQVGSTGVIRNVGLTNVNISASDANNNNYYYYYTQVGGLAGASSGLITNTYVTGSVTGGEGRTGGLVGFNYGTISNSYSAVNTTANMHYDDFLGTDSEIGGLAGFNTGTISKSHATGNVTVNMSNSVYGFEESLTGGLVGYNGGTVANSYATGSVSSIASNGNYYDAFTGGLIGYTYGSVSNSYATGAVTSAGGITGGLIGYGYGTVSNSYATGAVSGGVTGYAGGLMGENGATLSNSYSTGAVTSTGAINGGLVGYNYGTVANSFWNTETSGQATSAGGTGLTTQQMMAQSGFVSSGWDFANTWVMYEGFTNPLLRSFMSTLTVTANNASKTYDGTAYSGGNGVSYSVTPNSSLMGTLTYTGTSQGATNVNGNGYTISASGLYSGQQGYIIAYQDGTLTINPKTLTVSGTNVASKVYDGTTSASVSGGALNGVVGSDAVTLTQSGTFNSKNVGNGIAVTTVDTIGGAGASNYVLAQPTAVTGNITPATLTVSGTSVADKVYDGTTAAAVSGGTLHGMIGSDIVTLTQSGTFASKNAGTGVNVTTADTLGGAGASNYVVAQPTGLSANITPATLTVSGTSAASKVYDGTTAAAVSGGTLNGVIGPDTVTLTQSGTFASKNVGSGIAVTTSDTLGGAGAGNYVLAQPGGLSADITPATLTYTATAASGVSGQALPTLTGTLSGFVGGDTQASATTGDLAWTTSATTSSAAGVYSVNGGGLTASNYVFNEAPGNATALAINTAPSTGTAPVNNTASVNSLPFILSSAQTGVPKTGDTTSAFDVSSTVTGDAPASSGNASTSNQSDTALPSVAPTVTLNIGATGTLQIENTGVHLPAGALIGQN